ncbi:hypothetical protein EUGRSUZ_A00452 [Eucalyptus grandis]|uniref:Uncharacterized protein n=2 Tax=Eucalyptus grandis TaxID=71139 RepID=A0ACC3LZW1_EUCGR|nr:hypothetical protein EUGRSUZ_A00452 [Eucalyptus grandis]
MKSPANSEDFASQPTVPSRVISLPSQMDYTWNGNVPIFEPHRDSLLSFRKGHNGAADLPLPGLLQNTNCEDTMAFPVDENAPPTERQPISADPLSGLFSQGDIRIDSFGPPIRSPDIHSQMFNHSPIAPCPERAYAMEELHVDFDAMDSLWSDLP